MINSRATVSDLIHRADILDSITALHIALGNIETLLKEDAYTCGFREGYDAALLSLAQALGVFTEFRRKRQQTTQLASGRIALMQEDEL